MALSPADIASLVFKRANSDNLGEFSVDSKMLNILMEIDGHKNLGIIANKVGMSISDIKVVAARLLKQKLITPVENKINVLDKDFLSFLHSQLSQAVGPIAELLIEETISDLGHSISRFPANRAAELVELLANEIQREEKAIVFKQNIIHKIREKGY